METLLDRQELLGHKIMIFQLLEHNSGKCPSMAGATISFPSESLGTRNKKPFPKRLSTPRPIRASESRTIRRGSGRRRPGLPGAGPGPRRHLHNRGRGAGPPQNQAVFHPRQFRRAAGKKRLSGLNNLCWAVREREVITGSMKENNFQPPNPFPQGGGNTRGGQGSSCKKSCLSP